MKRDNVDYYVVGLFVLGIMGLLLVGLYQITGRVGRTDSYYARYANVAGLLDGTPVTFSGYPVGYVGGIEPVTEGSRLSYRVELRIKHGWPIPADSIAHIQATGLLSDMLVDIHPGQSPRHLAPGAELKTAEAVDVMAMVGTVADQLTSLSERGIQPLLADMDRYVDRIGSQVDQHIGAILARLDSLSRRLDQSAAALQAILSPANQARMARILRAADTTAGNAARLSAGLLVTGNRLDRLVGNLHGLLGDNREDLRRSVRALRHVMETLSGSVDSVVYNMRGTAHNMNEFSRELREDPALLLMGTRTEVDAHAGN